MKKHCVIICLHIFLGANLFLSAQEIRIFTKSDFNLKGNVASSTVITDYGKEVFYFDEAGYLSKLKTQFNDKDYSITYYKYDNGELKEKRVENYNDEVFDAATSIANFYSIDTTKNKVITEKIFSYDKKSLGEYVFSYNEKSKLESIKHTNEEGIDDTIIEYSDYKKEHTETHLFNGNIKKSIRTSSKKTKNNQTLTLVLTKSFLEGMPQTAIEETINEEELLLKKVTFTYDNKQKEFVPTEKVIYTYNETGMILSSTSKIEAEEVVKEFLYQYDGSEHKNWIKQIVTPENSYTTRLITYYVNQASIEEK